MYLEGEILWFMPPMFIILTTLWHTARGFAHQALSLFSIQHWKAGWSLGTRLGSSLSVDMRQSTAVMKLTPDKCPRQSWSISLTMYWAHSPSPQIVVNVQFHNAWLDISIHFTIFSVTAIDTPMWLVVGQYLSSNPLWNLSKKQATVPLRQFLSKRSGCFAWIPYSFTGLDSCPWECKVNFCTWQFHSKLHDSLVQGVLLKDYP